MWFSRAARNIAFLAIAALPLSASAPVSAAPAPACNVTKAGTFLAAGDRYRRAGRFGDALHWYLASARMTRGCTRGSAMLLQAGALAQAGAASAQDGDLLDALPLLQSAQSQLASLAASDPQLAPAARANIEGVAHMIAVIERVAQASM